MAEGGSSDYHPVKFELDGESGQQSRTSSRSSLTASGSSVIAGETKLSLSNYRTVRSSGTEKGIIQPIETILPSNVSLIDINNESSASGTQQLLTSTPIRTEVTVNPRSGSVEFTATDERESSPLLRSSRTLDPKEICIPVEGFEIMEQRARFTVFKLHVFIGSRDNWYVFRRYTDFYQLQQKLKVLFPVFHLNLPPKRWFKDNYDRNFLQDRILGLQAFINNIVRNTDVCNSKPVQEFFCFDDPPGHHDSLEESRAYCENLEESLYNVRKELRQKDGEIDLLQEELDLYKSQVTMLSQALREKNASSGKSSNAVPSPSSSLAECDILTQPEADQSQPVTQVTTCIQSEDVLQNEAGINQSDMIKKTAVDSSHQDLKENKTAKQQDGSDANKLKQNSKSRRSSRESPSHSGSAKPDRRKSGLLKVFS